MKSRSLVLTLGLLATLVITACGGGVSTVEPDNVVSLRILYTNDEEGFLLPSACLNTGGAIGMNRLWTENENCGDDNCLILSGGDVFISSPISSIFKGRTTVQVMNAMGYDALGIGNHELDFGVDNAAGLRESADFPFLSANYAARPGLRQFSMPATIIERQGMQIAIIGLTVTDPSILGNADSILDMSKLPYETALNDAVQSVEQRGGADVWILTFLGVEEGRYRFHEEITYGTERCVAEGLISLQSNSDGTWLWIGYFINGDQGARATLKKVW
jgi:2',3'-cyclic-nucleotide 2'-phosphodiesterase (5'-nucleotidase family)